MFGEETEVENVLLNILDTEIDNHLNYFDRIYELIREYIIEDRFDINVMDMFVLDCIYL